MSDQTEFPTQGANVDNIVRINARESQPFAEALFNYFTARKDTQDEAQPDGVIIEFPDFTTIIGSTAQQQKVEASFRTTFFADEKNRTYTIGESGVTLTANDTDEARQMLREIAERNAKLGLTNAQEIARKTSLFNVHTGQEMDVLVLSASDGQRQTNWRNEEQRGVRLWEKPGAGHRVELATSREERSKWDFAVLEKLTGAQNSDFALAMLYVVGILAPPNNLPSNRLAVEWIDLNDVMKKIGWLNEKPNAEKKEALRHQLWRFLIYGEEAIVSGQRSIKYVDPNTREEISTRIESPIWRVMMRQMPDQDVLFSEARPAPLRAQIAISKEWEPLLTAPLLRQYLPLGELLGAIPPNKVSGDWARSIGLILARVWRCSPRETLSGSINPTRRELLTHYAPKTKSVEEILSSNNPKRALEYYRDALNILLEAGLIAPKGDAAKEVTPEKMLEFLERKGWGDAWLNGASGLWPGAKWMPPVEERAAALPPLRPKDLKAKPKRPRKAPKTS